MNLFRIARGAARTILAHPAVRLAIAGGVIAWGVQELSSLVEDTKTQLSELVEQRDELAADIAQAQTLLMTLRATIDADADAAAAAAAAAVAVPAPRKPTQLEMLVDKINARQGWPPVIVDPSVFLDDDQADELAGPTPDPRAVADATLPDTHAPFKTGDRG